MKTHLSNLWEALRVSYWFVPSLMLVLAFVLSLVTLQADVTLGSRVTERVEWIYSSDPEGARKLLSTVAGSMISVAAVVFSITVLTLTLASNQFGHRLLRSFMRDAGNQFVLGTFVATFLYCLLILRRVSTDGSTVPQISVTTGILLAVVSLAVLIYFIHHVASSIQVGTIVSRVSAELHQVIDRLLPEEIRPGSPAPDNTRAEDLIPPRFGEQAARVPSIRSGYIQAIDEQRLLELAERHDLLLSLPHRPGGFVIAGIPLVLAWPEERWDERTTNAVRRAVIIGPQPTPEQDVEFSIRQLAEIATRALSPGINDPFTAVTCVDYLGAGLGTLARREFPAPYRYSRDGHKLRLITHPVTFADAVGAAFDPIRQYGSGHVAVVIRMLEVLATVAALVQRAEDRQALRRQAAMLAEEAARRIPEKMDRCDVDARYSAAVEALQDPA